MAKRPSTVTGLELEPSAVRAATVSTGGGLAIRHAAQRELPAGLVRDGEVHDPEALSVVLRELFAEHKALDKRVRVGIANAKIVARVIELPPITDDAELAAAVRFQAQEELPMPLDAAVVDHVALGLVDTEQGPRMRVALVAARKDMVEAVLAAVTAAGLRCEGIDLAAFGMVRALHRGATKDEAVVYLNVSGLTNLAVAEGTDVHFTRVVGGGLEAMAAELAERRGLEAWEARAVLAQTSLRVAASQLSVAPEHADAIEDARMVLAEGVRRIAADVRNSVDYHRTAAEESPVARCVLTGPVVAIDGFDALLAAELGMPVEAAVVPAPAGVDAAGVTVAAGLAVAEAIAA
jgi:type IV pilus assembly protein PilM